MSLIQNLKKRTPAQTTSEVMDDLDENDDQEEELDGSELSQEQKPPGPLLFRNPAFARKSIVMEEETEEDQPIQEVVRAPYKRRVGSRPEIVEESEELEDVSNPSPRVPISKRKEPPPAKREKVSLSVDISRHLHARLRIHSFKTGSSLGAIIEEMILQCHPE